MEINGVQIEDTFAEGFPIKMARVLDYRSNGALGSGGGA